MNDSAHLDQLLPIAAIAGKPRDFTCGDGADLTQTHFGYHDLDLPVKGKDGETTWRRPN